MHNEQDELFDLEFYETAIGPSKTDYYLQRFERFKRGESKISWNWPAFFVTFFWMLYRKMWGYAAIYFFVPSIVFYFLILALGLTLGAPGFALAFALQLGFMFVVMPMFANALYYRVVEKRVAQAQSYSADRSRQLRALADSGGTSIVALIVVLALSVGVVPVIGIIGAISIPAYQDYTIRAQVSEGLNLANAAKSAVAETVLAEDRVPANRVDAGMTTDPANTSGLYVASVDIVNGRIDITYGNNAHGLIAGRTVSLTPYVDENDPSAQRLIWR
ncbi:MAG: pilin, partial [Gammaproteobacteria bacterium]|nr:pilin [Gammaproteobacteria bacterium]